MDLAVEESPPDNLFYEDADKKNKIIKIVRILLWYSRAQQEEEYVYLRMLGEGPLQEGAGLPNPDEKQLFGFQLQRLLLQCSEVKIRSRSSNA